jgi:excisionase family DNA binding protein
MTTPLPTPVPLSERRTLHVPEACDYSGLERSRLYEFIRLGRIEAMTVGKRRLIFRESLDKFLTPKSQP